MSTRQCSVNIVPYHNKGIIYCYQTSSFPYIIWPFHPRPLGTLTPGLTTVAQIYHPSKFMNTWNNLPEDIFTTPTARAFKNLIEAHLKKFLNGRESSTNCLHRSSLFVSILGCLQRNGFGLDIRFQIYLTALFQHGFVKYFWSIACDFENLKKTNKTPYFDSTPSRYNVLCANFRQGTRT